MNSSRTPHSIIGRDRTMVGTVGKDQAVTPPPTSIQAVMVASVEKPRAKAACPGESIPNQYSFYSYDETLSPQVSFPMLTCSCCKAWPQAGISMLHIRDCCASSPTPHCTSWGIYSDKTPYRASAESSDLFSCTFKAGICSAHLGCSTSRQNRVLCLSFV